MSSSHNMFIILNLQILKQFSFLFLINPALNKNRRLLSWLCQVCYFGRYMCTKISKEIQLAAQIILLKNNVLSYVYHAHVFKIFY